MSDLVQRRNLVLAFACVVAPATVYIVVFRWLARRFGPDYGDPFPVPDAFAEQSDALIAADFAAREAFMLAATAMLVISVAALAFALAGVWRSHGRPGLIAGVAAALFSGGMAVADEGNPFRTFLFDEALKAATKAGALFEATRTQGAFADFITLNTFIGIGAVGAMMLRFGLLALRADGPSEASAQELAERSAAVRSSLMVGGLILTSAAATTYFLYHYPVALMEGDARLTQQSLASIASTRWGAIYTVVLITTAGPAFAAIHLDAEDALKAGAVPEGEAAPLLRSGDLFGGPLKALGAILAALAPAAIGPILGLLEPLLKLHGG